MILVSCREIKNKPDHKSSFNKKKKILFFGKLLKHLRVRKVDFLVEGTKYFYFKIVSSDEFYTNDCNDNI